MLNTFATNTSGHYAANTTSNFSESLGSTPLTSVPAQTGLEDAMKVYVQVHGPLALSVCIVGVLMNIVNIVVLSHKDMLSAVNRLLQAIAVMDMLTMLSYIPYSLMFYIIYGSEAGPNRNTYSAVCYLVFHATFSIVTHTASILLTVCVALFRYLYLSWRNGKERFNLRAANIAICVLIALSISLNIPQFTILTIREFKDPKTNASWYYVSSDRLGGASAAVNLAQYVIMAVMAKIGPSIMLVILSALLIRIILEAQRNYRKIQKNQSGECKRADQANQTTQLLVAVAILFTLAELPQGILFVMSGLDGDFFEKIYWPMGNLLDFLTIVSCTINFILYCSMSSQFRSVFVEMITVPSLLNKLAMQKERAAAANDDHRSKVRLNQSQITLKNESATASEQTNLLSETSHDTENGGSPRNRPQGFDI